jgi:quinol monooxygenase YgiN
MSSTPSSLLRIVRMSFKPELVSDFLLMFQEVKPQIEAMPGCSGVELKQDLHLEHVFYTISHWESEAHLNSYRNSALFAKTWAETKARFNDAPQAFSLVETP